MRPIGIGLATALMLAIFAPAATLTAAPKPTPAGAVSKDTRDKGMAAAPAVVASAKLDCQVADARLIGTNVDPKTKAKTNFYELACTGNHGLIVAEAPDHTYQVFTCMETGEPQADGKPNSLMCILPGNADPKAALAPYIAKGGEACTVEKARALGHSPSNTVFEVACQGGAGYIVQTSAPPRLDQPVVMKPCIMYEPGGNVECKFTDRAAQLAVADRLIAQTGKPCTVKDRGFIGVGRNGGLFFEVACTDGKGYVVEQAATGGLGRVLDCAAADALGGCKLTDAREARNEQNSLYTRLARKAGFECDVSGYAPFSISLPGKEVVELQCSNRPDGAVGVFSANSADKGVIYDCAHSELARYRCSLTKPITFYPKLTADLKRLGKDNCAVSNMRVVGVTSDKRGFIEVACADGLQGYMIEFATEPEIAPKQTIVCSAAGGIAGGCKLPGNIKS